MNKIKEFLGSDKVKGAVAIIAAVVMYFAPEDVDKVLETLLALYGIDRYVLKKKDKNDDTPVSKKDDKEEKE